MPIPVVFTYTGTPSTTYVGVPVQFNYCYDNFADGICEPLPGGVTLFWDFGDGNTSTNLTPVHSYATPGIYTVTCLPSSFSPPPTNEILITVNATPAPLYYYAGVVGYLSGTVLWGLDWTETSPGIPPYIDNTGLPQEKVGIVFTDPFALGARGTATVTATVNGIPSVSPITATVSEQLFSFRYHTTQGDMLYYSSYQTGYLGTSLPINGAMKQDDGANSTTYLDVYTCAVNEPINSQTFRNNTIIPYTIYQPYCMEIEIGTLANSTCQVGYWAYNGSQPWDSNVNYGNGGAPIYRADGQINGPFGNAPAATWGPGDRIGIVVDGLDFQMEFFLNGVSQGAGTFSFEFQDQGAFMAGYQVLI